MCIRDRARRSCVTPLSAVAGKSVRTIEGLAPVGGLHALQKAWLEHQAPQCGYCQSGMLMAAATLLEHTPKPMKPTDSSRPSSAVSSPGNSGSPKLDSSNANARPSPWL